MTLLTGLFILMFSRRKGMNVRERRKDVFQSFLYLSHVTYLVNSVFCKIFWGYLDRAEREVRNEKERLKDMLQRAPGWNRTRGRSS